MKNKKMILNTLMLSTLVLAPTISNVTTYAEESVDSAASKVVADDSAAVKAERDKVINLIAEAKGYIDYTKYEKAPVDTLNHFIGQVEDDLSKGEDFYGVGMWTTNYNVLLSNLSFVKNSPLKTTETSSSSSAVNSSSVENSSSLSSESSSSTSSNVESTNSSSSTSSSSSESTTSTTSSDSSTNTSTTDETTETTGTTSTTSETDNNVVIEAKDQTMYVGQKLTEDMVLGWAKFKNLQENDIYGFEVDKTIEVSMDSSILLGTGKYTITYFVIDPSLKENEDVIAEKSITLTVLGKEKNPFIPNVLTPDTKKPEKIINTSNKITPATTRTLKSAKKLPQTGEKENTTMTIVLGTGLIATVYFISRKKKETLI